MRIAFLRRKLVHLSAVAIIVATAVAGALTPGLASAEQNVATVPVDSAGMPASTYFPPTSHSPVSYTHLRAHETVLDLVCRLLLEKKNTRLPHMQYYFCDHQLLQHLTVE